jgi:hypothetical protein
VKDELLTPQQRKLVRREMKKQAREVCRGLTLEVVAKQYKVESNDPDAVAKAYAAIYLPDIRDAVAAGCKQGLLEAEG